MTDDCGCGPIALTGVHGPGCRLTPQQREQEAFRRGDPVRPAHSLHADMSGAVGTTYTCSCGAWDAWATGPTSTEQVKAEWYAHAGLTGPDGPQGPVIEGEVILGVVEPEERP